ncbi:uncharacterized protein DS421_20g695610 [Arachis hypogaea]|nr:uncharacterized protein DS421_20g695610 [Arachis hypogaea]
MGKEATAQSPPPLPSPPSHEELPWPRLSSSQVEEAGMTRGRKGAIALCRREPRRTLRRRGFRPCQIHHRPAIAVLLTPLTSSPPLLWCSRRHFCPCRHRHHRWKRERESSRRRLERRGLSCCCLRRDWSVGATAGVVAGLRTTAVLLVAMPPLCAGEREAAGSYRGEEA